MRRILFLLTILLNVSISQFFTSSCNSKDKTSNNIVFKIDLRNSYNESPKQRLKISDLNGQLHFVQLETTEESLIDKIYHIQLDSNYLFVQDSRRLLQFNQNGTYIRQIGRKGKGPGEHGSRIRFALNESRNELYLLNSPGTIQIFDYISGVYKRSFKVDFEVNKIEVFNDRIILFPTRLNPRIDKSKNKCSVVVTDTNGKIIKKVSDNEKDKNNNNLLGSVHVSKYGIDINFITLLKSTIYKIDENFEVNSYIQFGFDNKFKFEELIIEPDMGDIYDEYLSVISFTDCNEILFFQTMKGMLPKGRNHIQNFVFNKKNNELIKSDGFEIDYDENFTFWPKFSSANKLVSFYEAKELFDLFKLNINNDKLSPELMKMVSNNDINNNPVIAIFQFN